VKKKWMIKIKGMLVSKLDIDQKNSLYYEFEESKKNSYTYVFVNALTGNTSAWNGVIGKRVRDAGHGYLTYNFRGQINSSFDESINLTSEIIISDLLKLIDHLNLKNIILCGLSIGGLYAAIASLEEINVKGLVLINTLRKPSPRLDWINLAMVNAAKLGGSALIMDMGMPVIASPKFLDKVKTKALNFENYKPLKKNDGVFKLMEGSLSANWSFDWSKINIPTLVMTGHLDKMFRIPEDIEELVKKIKNSRTIELPNCGHLIPLEEPEEFSEHIINFANNLN
jgi:3-oxoadipate enol-lactonase